MVYVVGVTGGIGSGKTAVTDQFAALGVVIADADVAARTVVEPGTAALNSIQNHFGLTILDTEGRLDRAALRQIVFKDAEQRKWLESVTVPAILSELRHILDTATSDYAILMLSSGKGQSPWIHRNLVVDVPQDIQLARVMTRDSNNQEQVRAIIAAQPSRQDRLAYADDVITNDASISQLEGAVKTLHQQYLILARESS
ncbi:MAG: dephospho-CoA kinase [Patiriisocius sp.]|jgi:dephospho-CoA kinase